MTISCVPLLRTDFHSDQACYRQLSPSGLVCLLVVLRTASEAQQLQSRIHLTPCAVCQLMLHHFAVRSATHCGAQASLLSTLLKHRRCVQASQ